ncbi:FAD-dependent oxidoreductase [uncultured Tateyamaria sp.]|uniref:flavin monoamine oxidase family protein n=1 Tax=uncultured Tateyamaria sp. TaxID=455651 RepID=UPI00262245EA|nr:FAD-dependent oxidoreductase [uncultured Tateyamaria sp.]
MDLQTRTLIIGGGLSGLALADRLAAAGQDFQLVEARDRFGGRVLTDTIGGAAFDLGPAWFWPGQPRMAALLDRLGTGVFEQYAQGELMFEDESGQVAQGRGFASMQGSYRVVGGLGAVIDGLRRSLPQDRLHPSTPVTALHRVAGGVQVHTASGGRVTAQRVVLAMPQRLVAALDYQPPLPASAVSAITETATWMAGQAKAIAVYDRPFWREAGLSGDAMSRHGPMVEIHDASPAQGGPYALFGFVGVPAKGRRDQQALRTQVQAQLVRLFGAAAASPVAIVIKDWAFDPHTATTDDQQPLYAHPQYGVPQAAENMWDGALILSGTEAAPQFGGYLEGALEAAENTASSLGA